ncbi:MAG: M1 family peptidase [Chloroflexi bacterium]|nr:MAG: M1 family peptidase [Chloroflexota bacterium]
MHFRSFPIFAILFLLLSACAPIQAPPQANPADGATATAISMLATMVARTLAATSTPTAPPPTPTLTPAPTVTPAPSTVPGSPDAAVRRSLPHYKIDVEFSYAERYGKVTEEITYTNRAGDALNDLRLMVELFAYKDLFSFTGLWWNDGQKIENAAWENIEVRIPLRQPLLPGQTIGLKMTYEFRLPAQSSLNSERPLPIGYTSRQVNLVDWYPFIPPYRNGTGWLSHPPSYYGEHLVYDMSDFEVNLRLVDQRGDLVVAASAPAQNDGDWLRYSLENARSFALSVGHEYMSETAQVGAVTITRYYFILNAKAGKRALQTTAEALKLYQELFGPYPHSTLAVVEADFFDGMEYDGLYFSSRAFYNLHNGQPGDFLVAIAAHETAHQWWYALIGNDQANEPWLDEALCTYMERLYFERYYPEALDWWWTYRVNYYHPAGWVDTSVYIPKSASQTYQDYRNAVYLNGARFFEDLRKAMGDAAFFAFLKNYATQYAGQVALSSDFFALLRQHTQADLTPLLKQYFYHQY